MMNKIRYILILMILLFLFFFPGCKKDKPPRFPSPSWTVADNVEYSASMTAVVQLSPDLFRNKGKADKLAAFIDDECRGLGERIQLDSGAVFFVLIHGKPSEQSKIQFKYYSERSSYMYQTEAFLDFILDANYGTVDEPRVLKLKLMR